jgi:hypothetical protein
VAADVEHSRALDRAAMRPAAADDPETDRLAPFRGAPTGYTPAAFPDD